MTDPRIAAIEEFARNAYAYLVFATSEDFALGTDKYLRTGAELLFGEADEARFERGRR